MRKCKVCGREYEYCRSKRLENSFRWQDVACSPEHGSIYLAEIVASRTKLAAAQGAVGYTEGVAEKTVSFAVSNAERND